MSLEPRKINTENLFAISVKLNFSARKNQCNGSDDTRKADGDEGKVDVSNSTPRREHQFIHRIGWLRAAVLGANDGIISTASLIVGVAAASSDRTSILIAGVAGLVAGAMSMAAGEYVSVSSQSDTERAGLCADLGQLLSTTSPVV
jgi:hypothetical protein